MPPRRTNAISRWFHRVSINRCGWRRLREYRLRSFSAPIDVNEHAVLRVIDFNLSEFRTISRLDLEVTNTGGWRCENCFASTGRALKPILNICRWCVE